MSTTSAPFGLRPSMHPSGMIRPSAYSILSTYSTGILQQQPVKIGTNGTIEAAAIGDRFIGAFQGVEYTSASGRQVVSNQWTASTVGTNITAWVTLDPTIIYDIQCNGTLDVTSIGAQYAYTVITGGSTTTGLSGIMLDTGTSASNAALRIIGLTPGPDNAWGDNYPIVQVQVAQHQFVADIAAF